VSKKAKAPALAEVPITGREAERDLLQRALHSAAPPAALLISGPAGAGKKRLALWVTQALLCEAERGPCMECRQCRLAGSLNHPDQHVYLPHESPGSGPSDGQIGKVQEMRQEALEELRGKALHDNDTAGTSYYVATIRALAKGVQSKAHRDGGRRVIVIADADRMGNSVEAQNALLKILEEPPAGTHFVLTASAPQYLLPTVRSRTAEFILTPMETSEVEAVLVAGGTDPEQAKLAAARSRGLPGAALETLSEEWTDTRKHALNLLYTTINADHAKRLDLSTGLKVDQLESLLVHLNAVVYDAARLSAGKATAEEVPEVARVLALVPAEERPSLDGWGLAARALGEARLQLDRAGIPGLVAHTLGRSLSRALACKPPRVATRQDRVNRLGRALGGGVMGPTR
jgi:DNA polymerase III subunit delta'